MERCNRGMEVERTDQKKKPKELIANNVRRPKDWLTVEVSG